MIHDVDETLRALIQRDAVNGAGVDVSFDAPTKDWAARRNAPAVNLYLYDIHEDLERRNAQVREVRARVDGRDVVVDRRLPPRRFTLSYLVTAWTQRPEDEHRLLSAVLAALIRHQTLPEDLLHGALALPAPHEDHPYSLRITVGLPPSKERSLSDIWSALGGELKPSLDVVVLAPFDPDLHRPMGPLVTDVVVDARDLVETDRGERRHRASAATDHANGAGGERGQR